MTKANKYVKENFEEFEDEYTNKVCCSCGDTFDEDEDIDECPDEDCDGEVVLESLIEGQNCLICNGEFVMMEDDIHQHKDESGNYICGGCYEDLPSEDDNEEEDAE